MRMITLLFKGASGYTNNFSGHKKGATKDYPETVAMELVRDYSGAFEVISSKIVPDKEEKKVITPENKAIESAPLNKNINEEKKDTAVIEDDEDTDGVRKILRRRK